MTIIILYLLLGVIVAAACHYHALETLALPAYRRLNRRQKLTILIVCAIAICLTWPVWVGFFLTRFLR